MQVILLVRVGIQALLVMALDRKVTSELKVLYALLVMPDISFMVQKKELVYPMAPGLGDSQNAKVISSWSELY